MTRASLVVAVAACTTGSPKPLPPVKEMTMDEWIHRCADRIDVARIAVARADHAFGRAEITTSAEPHNPQVNIHLAVPPDGYFTAHVERGRSSCFDKPGPTVEWHEVPWSKIILWRERVLDGDRAYMEGNRVSPSTAKLFRREMERALEQCLIEARGVPIAKVDCAKTESM